MTLENLFSIAVIFGVAATMYYIYRKESESRKLDWRFCIRCERFFNGYGDMKACLRTEDIRGPDGVCHECGSDLRYRES